MAQSFDEMAKDITVAAVNNPNLITTSMLNDAKIKVICDLYKEILKTIKENR